LVLVGGAERTGDDGELSFAVEEPCGFVGQGVADPFGCSLIDEVIAGVGFGVGIPGENFDAALARFAKNRGDARLVFDGDSNSVHAASYPTLDEFILLGGLETCGTVPDEFHAKLKRRFFGTPAAAHKIRIALGFRHHGDNRRTFPGGWGGGTFERSHQPDVGAGDDQRGSENDGAQNCDLAVLHGMRDPS
jgi:hypothetical protein